MRKDANLTDWKSNANRRRVRSIAGQTLIQIFEVYDDRAIFAHLVNILRSRGIITGHNKDGSPIFRDPYFIKDDEGLKIIETYREDLDLIALESAQIAKNDGIEG